VPAASFVFLSLSLPMLDHVTANGAVALINARTGRWIGNRPSGLDAHPVAADPCRGNVFVPVAASLAGGACRPGCGAVFAPRRGI
jgi:hypothetical protein